MFPMAIISAELLRDFILRYFSLYWDEPLMLILFTASEQGNQGNQFIVLTQKFFGKIKVRHNRSLYCHLLHLSIPVKFLYFIPRSLKYRIKQRKPQECPFIPLLSYTDVYSSADYSL